MKKNCWMMKHIILLVFFSSVYAQDESLVERAWDFGIGLGYGVQSNPFIGADEVPTYITFDLAVYGKRFFFDNGDVGFTLVDRETYGLNLIATYSSERIYYSFFNTLGILANDIGLTSPAPPLVVEITPSDTLVNPGFILLDFDLPDRAFAINVGAELLLSKPFGNLQIQALSDISSKHTGQEFSIEYSRTWGSGRWRFQPSIGINWKSSDLVDYYYGFDFKSIDPNISISYRGEDVINYSVGLVSSYRINNHVSLVASMKYNRFGSAISNSPLVVDNFSKSFFTGVFYSF